MHRPLTCLPELKVLPTQPETPTIPEEEEDDDGTGRALADHDESEGVEVRLTWLCRTAMHAVDDRRR